jgi:hypothetical protein
MPATSRKKKEGYVEERDYWVAPWAGQVLTLPGMMQAVAVRRRFTPIDPKTPPKAEEWRYYATSAEAEEADARTLANPIRNHWQIENGLHYPKDYTMGEDQHTLRKGAAPIILSMLRSITLGLLRTIELPGLVAQTFPQKMAFLCARPSLAADLINGRAIVKRRP